ncbi:TPA: hypothetical protein KSK92_000748 [Clostridioides difficile]|nr:hypothetical protein [Clostridioides difficile]EQK24599.1 hypothetical protein QUY_1215 [Clostridioides difficile P71]MBF9965425.1 hypothetical protein [Clostridioides difficile]MBH7392013.1 hypothetical protein [Clostridioides difficile]MBH7749833.1 hypothetical protein [Clostridioides difficile]MBY1278412.1 hypothetical protein [Clostridioides difficile]
MEVLNLFWGFILTKWYVKTEPTNIVGLKSTSFILTKWYVKTDIISK